MADPIKLHCLGCRRWVEYDREIDPDIPPEVVLIQTSNCDRCDDGGFGEEHQFDASGNEVISDWAKEPSNG